MHTWGAFHPPQTPERCFRHVNRLASWLSSHRRDDDEGFLKPPLLDSWSWSAFTARMSTTMENDIGWTGDRAEGGEGAFLERGLCVCCSSVVRERGPMLAVTKGGLFCWALQMFVEVHDEGLVVRHSTAIQAHNGSLVKTIATNTWCFYKVDGWAGAKRHHLLTSCVRRLNLLLICTTVCDFPPMAAIQVCTCQKY